MIGTPGRSGSRVRVEGVARRVLPRRGFCHGGILDKGRGPSGGADRLICRPVLKLDRKPSKFEIASHYTSHENRAFKNNILTTTVRPLPIEDRGGP